MPFVKGQPRPPNAGRRKGSVNKITQDVAVRLAEIGCDPVQGLATLAMDEKVPEAIRLRANAELLEYVKPKLSRHEVVGPIGTSGIAGPVELTVTYVNKPKPE